MSENAKIAAESQKLQQDALVELFVLDLSGIGGETFRFHNQPVGGDGKITFGGDEYVTLPFQAKGFTAAADDTPRPTITVGNVGSLISTLIRDFDDLLGAKLIRIRTFRKHLGDGSDPDGLAKFSEDIFFVDRKQSENKLYVEFALGSSLDIEGVKLPARQVLTRCRWQFKDGVNCPYNGPEATCGKTLGDCTGYFGANAILPFGGFPGVSRVRLNF